MKYKYWPQVKGKTGKFETHIEIPVTVYYTFNPAERMTRNHPGSPACVDNDYIEYKEKELPRKIAEDYEDVLM